MVGVILRLLLQGESPTKVDQGLLFYEQDKEKIRMNYRFFGCGASAGHFLRCDATPASYPRHPY
jgi:hypothetical protein